MKRGVSLGTILLCIAVLAACGGASHPAYPVTPLTSEGSDSGFAADFRIVAYQGEGVLGGKEVWLSSLFSRDPGVKLPVVLNFWAGQCPPCRAEMPDLQQIYEEYQGRILLFGLDVGPFVGLGTREDGRALLEELEVTYPAGTTFDAGVVGDYRVLGMPTTVFLKPNGEFVRTWTGALNKGKLVELVEELLAKSRNL
ncbi:MAG: TlpA family protein disulfide reductase [Dehalococcoidia bacterium]